MVAAALGARPTKHRHPATIVLDVDDMPDYPSSLKENVAGLVEQLPIERRLFTYRDIQTFFGVSRATVGRRLKDGVVPGVRMAEGRVLGDGSVRRFDREQLKWLLLAVLSPPPSA